MTNWFIGPTFTSSLKCYINYDVFPVSEDRTADGISYGRILTTRERSKLFIAPELVVHIIILPHNNYAITVDRFAFVFSLTEKTIGRVCDTLR